MKLFVIPFCGPLADWLIAPFFPLQEVEMCGFLFGSAFFRPQFKGEYCYPTSSTPSVLLGSSRLVVHLLTTQAPIFPGGGTHRHCCAYPLILFKPLPSRPDRCYRAWTSCCKSQGSLAVAEDCSWIFFFPYFSRLMFGRRHPANRVLSFVKPTATGPCTLL